MHKPLFVQPRHHPYPIPKMGKPAQKPALLPIIGPNPLGPIPSPNGISSHPPFLPRRLPIGIPHAVVVVRIAESVSPIGIAAGRAVSGPTPSVRGTRPGRTPPPHSKAHSLTEETEAPTEPHPVAPPEDSSTTEASATSPHRDHPSFSSSSRRLVSASSCCSNASF